MPKISYLPQDIVLSSFRGGMSEDIPEHALPEDMCVLALNIEFFYSSLGERRLGCEAVDITGSSLLDQTQVCHISEWFPTNVITLPEWWSVSVTPNSATTVARRQTDGTWQPIIPVDLVSPTTPDVYDINSHPMSWKLFFAYPSDVDRFHCWDQTTLRRVSIIPPAVAPTAVDEGSGSTFTSVRYYRVRFTKQVGSVVQLRSEPTPVLTFTPGGSGDGATVTHPTIDANEPATNWELEASKDNANFYRIGSAPLATASLDDTTQNSTSYADVGPLSEAKGAYLPLPSARFVNVDADRLILAGSYENVGFSSRVMWTPPVNDPGVGNNERLPIVTTGGQPINSFIDLDPSDGGGITGISQVANGTWYVFKWSRIYKMVRTGDVVSPYQVVTISEVRGAVPGSICSGMDEYGQPCIFFLDPGAGPSRLGQQGLETVRGLYRQTWQHINLQAAFIIARSCYYPDKGQVHWWISIDHSDSPNLKLILQVGEIQDTGVQGAFRGWSVATGQICSIWSVGVLHEIVTLGNLATLHLTQRPYLGMDGGRGIQRSDTGSTDAGVPFTAILRSKPYIVNSLMQRIGVMSGTLLANADPTAHVGIILIKNFGTQESVQLVTPLNESADFTILAFDNLNLSDVKTVQIQFQDP